MFSIFLPIIIFGAVSPAPVTLYGILSGGQSLANGVPAGTATTLAQPYNNVMLWTTSESFRPLVAVSGGLEYPVISGGRWLRTQSADYQVVGLPHGIGGQSLANLSKGGSSGGFENGMAQVALAVTEATRTSRTLVVPIIDWLHGESDTVAGTDPAAYKTGLLQLVVDYDTDTKAQTGQSEDVQMVLSQVSSSFDRIGGSTIAVAMWEVARDNATVYSAGPRYQYEYNADGSVHLSGAGYQMLGEMHAKVWQKVIESAAWSPLYALSAVRTAGTIVVTFNVPVGNLTIDTTNVVAAGDYGVEWYDSGDGNAATISSVTVTGADELTVVLDVTPTGTGQELRFGLQNMDYTAGVGYDSVDQPRTNLRDQDGSVSVWGYDLYNWCVHHAISVTV